MRDSVARHREMLQEGLSRCAKDLEPETGRLLREQLAASEPTGYEAAALACLSAAEAVGGTAAAALPGALSVAFLGQMGLVFAGLEDSGGAAGLSTAWAMPRALNAGDAMFALAQESILSAPNELTAADRLAAVALLDRGGRDLVDALYAAGEEGDGVVAGQRALLPVAFALGALLGGADVQGRERLAQLGRAWSSLPENELSRNLAGDAAGWLAT